MVHLLLNSETSVLDRSRKHAPKIRRTILWESAGIHYAAAGGHMNVILVLFDAGFDKEQRNRAGLTLFQVCAKYSKSSAATIYHLLPKDKRARLVHDYVNMAAEDVDIMAGLAEGGFFLNWQDEIRNAPLHREAEFDHNKIDNALMRNGVETDIRNRRGGTPLHVAASNGCLEIASSLINSKANTESC